MEWTAGAPSPSSPVSGLGSSAHIFLLLNAGTACHLVGPYEQKACSERAEVPGYVSVFVAQGPDLRGSERHAVFSLWTSCQLLPSGHLVPRYLVRGCLSAVSLFMFISAMRSCHLLCSLFTLSMLFDRISL